jgi:hypothetical protein
MSNPSNSQNHKRTPHGSPPTEPRSEGSDLSALSIIGDWRHVPFLMVDSPKTKLLEDAVAAQALPAKRGWSTDLKVIHPLPLQGAVSLKEGEKQICLGIRDAVNSRGVGEPTVSLVVAEKLTRITDGQAEALLADRERGVTGIGGQERPDPALVQNIKTHLKLVRATALQISAWKDRELTPEHSMAIVVTRAQTAAIQASRGLRECPSLVVLRHEGSRVMTDAEARRRGMNFATKTGVMTVAAGKAVPTLLRQSDRVDAHDSLRLKERGNSGSINITQISCALLGISPIPEDLVRQGLRPDSELDRWKKGGPLPAALAAAINDRREAIREVLKKLLGE